MELSWLHFRFEPDALARAIPPYNYKKLLLHFLEKLPVLEASWSFSVTALSLAEVKQFPMIQKVQELYPGTILTNKEHFGAETSEITFVNAALDFEISLRADYFVGAAQSSFSAFVALGRYHWSRSSTLFPAQELRNLCSLKRIHDWQFELQLPYNDCFAKDPCALLMLLSDHPETPRRCVMHITGSQLRNESFCSGQMLWGNNCPKSTAIHGLIHQHISPSLPIAPFEIKNLSP